MFEGPLPVRDLQPGDIVDLFGDVYADPNKDPSRGYEFEMPTVVEVEWEYSGCIFVGLDAFGGVGFPPDHKVYTYRKPDHSEREN